MRWGVAGAVVFIVVVLLVLRAGTLDLAQTGAFISEAEETREHVPGEVLVKFREDPEFREANILERVFLDAPRVVGADTGTNDVNRRAGVQGFEKVSEDLHKMEFNANSDIEAIAGEYKSLEVVEYAEPNYLYGLVETPNDPSFSSQWSLNQASDKDIDAPEAWDIEVGNSSIIIAVVDTGVDWDHPDLSGNIWNNTGDDCDNSTDLDSNGYNGDCRGYDFVSVLSSCASDEDCTTEDNNPMDFQGHGTHCAGIVAAVGNNSVGVAGSCWNCTIMPVRAGFKGSDGNGYLAVADIAQAIEYAADNGAHVISMSFGGSHSSTIQSAIDYAYGKGVVLIASAGNDNTDSKSYPAGYGNVISVSSTTSTDAKSSFSNYGNWVDVAAPGSSIYSTCYDDTYCTKSGTSMSGPHVAGLAGLILSHNSSFSYEQVRSVIRTSVDVVSYSVYMGTGRINAHSAVQTNSTPVAVLDQGLGDSDRSGTVRINGTANSTILNYSVYYASGLYPNAWTLIGNETQEVNSSNLTDWETPSLLDGDYTIWLSVFDTSGQEANETMPVTLDNAPVIALAEPQNNTWHNTGMQANISIINSDDTTLFSNDSYSTNYTSFNISTAGWDEGSAVVWVWANDSAGQMSEDSFTFHLDSGNAPSIALVSPANSSYANSGTLINISFLDTGELNTTLWSNDSYSTNYTSFNISTAGWAEQEHELRVMANDSAGNSNTSVFNITLDNTPISMVNITSPTPANGSSQVVSSIYVNASLSEVPDSCLLEWDDGSLANESMTVSGEGCYRSMLVLAAYNYTFRVYASDRAGNLNTSELREVEVTAVNLSVNVTSPESGSWESGGFSAAYTPAGMGLQNCSLYTNSSGWGINQTNSSPLSGQADGFTLAAPEGSYLLNVVCSNGTDEARHSGNITVSVDRTSPMVVVASPGNRTYQQNQELNLSYTEEHPDSCWYWNGTGNTSLASCDTNGTNLSGSEGQNPLILYINDSAGSAGSDSLYWSLDTIKPLVELISPANASSWTSSSTVAFSYNVSDAQVANCSLILDRTLVQTDDSVTVNTSQSFSRSVSNGNHVWRVNCTDIAGWENASLAWNLTVSYTAPAVSGGGGGGGAVTEIMGAASASTTKSWSVITPGVEKSMNVGGGAVSAIEFSTTERAVGAEISVEVLSEPPVAESPVEEVYQYLDISQKKLEEEVLESLEITFSVNMSWIEENSMDINTIRLNRYAGEWQELATTLLGTDSGQANFTAQSPGFSYFAVTGERLMVVHEVCGAGERRCSGGEVQECSGNEWALAESCEFGCNATSLACNPEPAGPAEKEGPAGEGLHDILVALALIIIIAITIFVYWVKK